MGVYQCLDRAEHSQNLEYARTLLLRLEHTSSRLKIQSRRQQAQSTLLDQRALLKRLTNRLNELDQQDQDWPSDASVEEALLSDDEPVAPTTDFASTELDKRKPAPTAIENGGLRNRFQPSLPITPTTPFSPTPSFPNNDTTNTAALLEADSTTQATLTSSLSQLASQLKSNSILFSEALEADKAAMSQASESLDRNADGMATAGKRMGLLRRMNEGQGWWGRMMLYAWIGGLWVVAILLVFVGPKFRF